MTLSELKAILRDWARWRAITAHGYPTQSSIMWAREGAGDRPFGPRIPRIECSENVGRIMRAIDCIKATEPGRQAMAAIEHYYCYPAKTNKQTAMNFGVSKRRFEDLVQRGHEYLLMFFAGQCVHQ